MEARDINLPGVLLGVVLAAAGTVVSYAATSWISSVSSAQAEQEDTLADHETRMTVMENDLGYIVKSQDRMEDTLKEIKEGQESFRAVIQNLPAVREARDGHR